MILLNPVFNFAKSFMSFSFDKVTTGTYNFVSVILNVAPDGATTAGSTPASAVISTEIHFFDQFKISSTLQLIKGIFKLLQKLLKCFSEITTFAPVNESLSSGVFPTILAFFKKGLELRERGVLCSSL